MVCIMSSVTVCFCRLGESCSHVAPILFKIESAVRLGHTSATANQCKWNKTLLLLRLIFTHVILALHRFTVESILFWYAITNQNMD